MKRTLGATLTRGAAARWLLNAAEDPRISKTDVRSLSNRIGDACALYKATGGRLGLKFLNRANTKTRTVEVTELERWWESIHSPAFAKGGYCDARR